MSVKHVKLRQVLHQKNPADVLGGVQDAKEEERKDQDLGLQGAHLQVSRRHQEAAPGEGSQGGEKVQKEEEKGGRRRR